MSLLLLRLLLLLLPSLLLPCATAELPTLKVTVIKAEGFCEWDDSTNQFVGFIPEVVQSIGRQAKFQPLLVEVGDGRYGAFEEKSGRWSGLIGEVLNGSADMAAAPLTLTALREKHIDFTHEILDVGLVTIAKAPTVRHPVTRSAAFFLSIFDFGVWLSAAVVFVATSLLLAINARYNPREPKPEAGSPVLGSSVQEGDFSLLGSLFYAISTGCFQGYSTSPRSLAGRCLSVFWWLFVAIFAATYVAGFLCGLVASKGSLDNSIVSRDPRDQLARNGQAFDDYVPVWLPGGSTDRMMQNSKEHLFSLFWRLNSQFRKKDKRLDGLNKVSKLLELVETDEKFIGIMESDMAYLYARRSNCRLVVSGSLLTDKSYAFALAENSTWRAKVNHAIMQLRENGFIRSTYRKFFGSTNSFCGPPPRPIQLNVIGEDLASTFRDSLPIGIGTFAGPLGLYCVGLLVSCLAAVIDGYIFTRYERYRQPAQPFHGIQETAEPSFGALSFSDDRQPVVQHQES